MTKRTDLAFEQFVRKHNAIPWGKTTEPDGTEILLADVFHPAFSMAWEEGKSVDGIPWRKEYPAGLYQTIYAVKRGGFDVMSWLEFKPDHDSQWTRSMREEGRINKALEVARTWILLSKQAGHYAH